MSDRLALKRAILADLAVLWHPGDVREVRIPAPTGRQGRTDSGYFDQPELLAEAVAGGAYTAASVYVTINPVKPALLSRAANGIKTYAKQTTNDNDVTRRRYLPLDFDPERPTGISSSDAEHEAALQAARAVRDWLRGQGWPDPRLADSGNGGHLLYDIDLPNDATSRTLIQQCLQAVAAWLSVPGIVFDTSVYNAARIWKLYGTTARKGDCTAERPHRQSRILEPGTSATVTQDLLLALAAVAPKVEQEPPPQRTAGGHGFDIERWIAEQRLVVRHSGAYDGGKKWVLETCPFNPDHGHDAGIFEAGNGRLGFHCFHNGCNGRNWRELRELLDPKARRTHGHAGANGQVREDAAESAEQETPAEEEARQSRAQLIRLSDVQPETVRWLWAGRIPLGKLTVLDGDPGLGKSTMTLDIAARVSTGSPLPDGSMSDLAGPGGVVLLSAEDGLADTIRPRLDAAGADCRRVVALEGYLDPDSKSHGVTLADVDVLRQAIQSVAAALVVIDPLMSYLPGRADAHRDQDIRTALSPLAALAEATGAAVVVIRHLNKAAGGPALYRGSGSIAIIGAARSGLLVAPDPDDDTRRIVAMTKSNLAAPVTALAYRIEDYPPSMRIRWEGATAHTASSLLSIPEEPEEKSAVDDAMHFLRDLLQRGPVEATGVRAEAKTAGVAERTLFRAKAALRVASQKQGASWQWVMPEQGCHQHCRLHPPGNLGSLGSFGNVPFVATPAAPVQDCQHCQHCQDCQGGVDGNVGGSLGSTNGVGHVQANVLWEPVGADWEEIPADTEDSRHVLVNGLEIRADLVSGKRWARWLLTCPDCCGPLDGAFHDLGYGTRLGTWCDACSKTVWQPEEAEASA